MPVDNPAIAAELVDAYNTWYDSWIARVDEELERGHTAIGNIDEVATLLPSESINTSLFTAPDALFSGGPGSHPGIGSRLEGQTASGEPQRAFWLVHVRDRGRYAIRLRRFPSEKYDPPSMADAPIDPSATQSTNDDQGTVRLVISPDHLDVRHLVDLIGSQRSNTIDRTNHIGPEDTYSEFRVDLRPGFVFLGSDMSGRLEFDPGCERYQFDTAQNRLIVDESVAPTICPPIQRSAYFVDIEYLGRSNY